MFNHHQLKYKLLFLGVDTLILAITLYGLSLHFFQNTPAESLIYIAMTILISSSLSSSIDLLYFDDLLINTRLLLKGIAFSCLFFLLIKQFSTLPIAIIAYIIWYILSTSLKLLYSKRKKPLKVLTTSENFFQELKNLHLVSPSLANPNIQSIDISAFDIFCIDSLEKLSLKEQQLASNCKILNIPTMDLYDFEEFFYNRINTPSLNHTLIHKEISSESAYTFFKPFLEKLLILLFSPVILSLCLFVALTIRINMGKKIIFKQLRMGQNSKPFTIYKFRTMSLSSEKNGAQFAQDNDQRVSSFGKILRKFRLDELPQLWNVLKGNMSIIGPRPEQIPFATQFSKEIPLYYLRHTVKPGITGWAQVNQGYADSKDSTELKLKYDMFYIKHFSFWLDLKVVLKTISTVLTGFGHK